LKTKIGGTGDQSKTYHGRSGGGSLEDAVRTTVCLGGDTDTLAYTAGAVAEVIHGLPRNIADSARAYLTDDLRVVLERFEAAVRA